MIKAIIVDDEISGAETLSILLKKYCPEVEISGMAHSAREGEQLLRKDKPQLLFLDIEMPHESGFDLLEKVRDLDFEIVFTTAYDQYGIKAIKAGAMDYLLKPINNIELQKAVAKVSEYLHKQASSRQRRDEVLQNLRAPSLKRLGIPGTDGTVYVDLDQVTRMEGDVNYTHIHMADKKKYTVPKTLLEYEELLQDTQFFRIHKSHLVNLDFVVRYIKGDGGFVVMKDNSQIEVSRRRRAELFEKMNGK